MNEKTIFLKLGGSLLTDKLGVEAVRDDVLTRVSREIGSALAARPAFRLLLGHGSGSFGHVAAAKHGTRLGVRTAAQWRGFAEVSVTAARLNRLVVDALQAAGVPALTFQPSASVLCENGRLQHIAVYPIQLALDAGLLPVIHGDVAFDTAQGGTIVSTEAIMVALADALHPDWLLLAGETNGVYDKTGKTIPAINAANFDTVKDALGGSRGTDVTGGMVTKVESMLALVQRFPSLKIRIFSGLEPGSVATQLRVPERPLGTMISQ